jgi:hypothetical protein
MKNTKKRYGPKEDKFKAYCLATSVSPSSRQFPHQIEVEKVFRFIVYQCTHEKKRKGAKKKDSPNFGSLEPFDLKDYRAVMSRFQSENSFDPGTMIISPKDGLGWQAIAQYKAVIMAMHQEQVEQKRNTDHWDFIWTKRARKWTLHVKTRCLKQMRESYAEKAANDEFAPYLMVGQRGNVEQEV